MKQTENAAGCLAVGEYESGRHACLTSSASLHAANTHRLAVLLSASLFCLLALTRRLHRVAFITTNTAPCYLFLRTPSSSHKLSLSFSSHLYISLLHMQTKTSRHLWKMLNLGLLCINRRSQFHSTYHFFTFLFVLWLPVTLCHCAFCHFVCWLNGKLYSR